MRRSTCLVMWAQPYATPKNHHAGSAVWVEVDFGGDGTEVAGHVSGSDDDHVTMPPPAEPENHVTVPALGSPTSSLFLTHLASAR